MRLWLLALCAIPAVVCPPPRREAAVPPANAPDPSANAHQQQGQQQQQQQDPNQKPLYEFTYNKYLEEVVKILENDPKFTERLKGMQEEDIKAGKIADHIDDLDQHVFDRLTKIKLQEIERLREQIQKQIEADGHANNIKLPDHLDVNDWEKFGKEDLRKLIQKTVADMNEMDAKRRGDFKEYEMKKKAEEDHRLAQMNDEERKKAEEEDKARDARHNEHEKLKHPGSRDQLEEVWEDSDHMEKDNFDPKTFFALHDLNGDGLWNSEELEALFQLELEKMYNDTNPDDDPRERMEEMYRMREHVVTQMDKNNDRLISLQEFLQDTEAQTPNKDEGWKDLAEQQVYTDEELQTFEDEYAKQMAPLGTQQHAQPVQAEVHHGAQQQQVHAAQPAQQVVAEQPAHPAPAQHAQPPEPIVEVAKDPSYGI